MPAARARCGCLARVCRNRSLRTRARQGERAGGRWRGRPRHCRSERVKRTVIRTSTRAMCRVRAVDRCALSGVTVWQSVAGSSATTPLLPRSLRGVRGCRATMSRRKTQPWRSSALRMTGWLRSRSSWGHVAGLDVRNEIHGTRRLDRHRRDRRDGHPCLCRQTSRLCAREGWCLHGLDHSGARRTLGLWLPRRALPLCRVPTAQA